MWPSQDRKGAGLSNSTLVLIGDFSVTALRECALATHFHLIKDIAFSIIISPVTGFPLEHYAGNHLYNTLSK
jgi:hypothetical protein